MSTPDDALIDALQQAARADPANLTLRLHLVDQLEAAGRAAEVTAQLREAAGHAPDDRAVASRLVGALRRSGELAEALIRAEQLLEAQDDPALRVELARILRDRGDDTAALRAYLQATDADPTQTDPALEPLRTGGAPATPTPGGRPPEPEPELAAASVTPEGTDPQDWAGQFDWGDLHITFEDVVGLDEVKDQINLRILAPFKNPEIYRAFNRSGGGGILLYGPPGCGKTFIARATAGEVGARFLSVGINDILDKYWGESERLIHALFEDARKNAPTVLFFDEFDALGSSRGRSESQFWKTLVDQLLQEMDGMGGRNDDLLVFAATNTPWNVDTAFRRPGRFDRIFFVPPPDAPARAEILRRHTVGLPGGETVDTQGLSQATPLWTGADLKALAERASERALSRSLQTSEVHPVSAADFEAALGKMASTASEWLATARNYARYSNEGGQYDELAAYLKHVKKWL